MYATFAIPDSSRQVPRRSTRLRVSFRLTTLGRLPSSLIACGTPSVRGTTVGGPSRPTWTGFGGTSSSTTRSKYPNAATEWGWQFAFPAARICRDPQFGPPSWYHLHESVVQRAREKPARSALSVVSCGPRRVSAAPFWIAVPQAAAPTPVAGVSLGRAPHYADRCSTESRA